MKYAEKLQLLLKGVKMEEIKDLEAQEKEELDAAAAALNNDAGGSKEDGANGSDAAGSVGDSEALAAAQVMITELETKLANTQDELTKLNSEIAAINNRATQVEDLPKYDATAVFGELFNKAKQEV